MTAALAWIDGDRAYVAVDGRVTCGGNALSDKAEKFFSVGGWIVVCCGSARWWTLVEAAIARDQVPSLATIYDLADWLRSLLAADDWGRGENNGSRVYPDFLALTIGWSGAHEISCDFSVVTAAPGDVLFAGSGGDIALGAFLGLRSHAEHLPGVRAAEMSIEIAGRVDEATGGNATVRSCVIREA